MPYTLKKNKFKYKNPDTGNYEGVDVVAERSFADYQSALENVGLQQQTVVRSEGTTQKNAVTAAGTAAVANFPATAAACDTLAGDFAATYVPDQAYSVGDYCTYQYQLYQCKTAIAANTDHTFVTSHWNLITVTDTINDQVDDLKTQFDNYAQLQEINEQIRKGELIPFDDYTLVEYIQSDATDAGQAKINTGLMLGPTLRTELDMALTQIGIENYMGREGVNGKNVRNSIGCSASLAEDGFYFAFGNENLSLGTADTQRHLFYIDVPNLVYGYDDVKADKSPFTYGSEYSSYSIYLFGRYAGGTVTSHAKLYSAKFYSSGVLVSYFVPVVRQSDNRPGMYDVIRQEFYTNTIVGKLTAGDPIIYVDDTLSISGVPADAKATGDAIQAVDDKIDAADDRIEVLENTDKSYGHDVKYDEFSACMQSTGAVSPYIFFTDPHIYRSDVTEEVQASLFGKLREAYNSTPTDFVMCGGDWLQGGDLDVIPGGPTTAQACAQLGFVDGIMNKLFNAYKPIFGNHDRNFFTLHEGVRQTLTRQTVHNLMFRKCAENDKNYYDFVSDGTHYYVFDTERAENPDDTVQSSYLKDQLSWFANALLNVPESNVAVCLHILYTTTSGQISQLKLSQFGRYISEIAAAYNARTSYTAEWTDPEAVYNYAGKTGYIRYIIAGHTHYDMIVQASGIPCVIVTNALYNWVTPTFDLCAEDYGANILSLIRVGNGSNRYVHFGLTNASAGVTLTPAKITASGWQSSDTNVATVASGVVTAVAAGTALISAADASGNTEAWVVSVTA